MNVTKCHILIQNSQLAYLTPCFGGSVAEWLALRGLVSNRIRDAVGQLLGELCTHRTSVHQAAKLVAALLRVATVSPGLAESNGSLPPNL